MTGLTRVSHGLPKVNGTERPCLVEIYGPSLGRTVPLEGPITMLGRAVDCDLVLALDNVSRQHCAVHARENGHFIRDAESTNGTFVNDEELVGERRLRGAVPRDHLPAHHHGWAHAAAQQALLGRVPRARDGPCGQTP